jgi:hypothetical protein
MKRYTPENLLQPGLYQIRALRSLQKHIEQTLARRIHHQRHVLAGRNIGLLLHQRNGGINAAQFIHQAILLRLRPQPHAPLRQWFNLVVTAVPRGRHFANEIPVVFVDALAQDLALVGRQPRVVGIDIRVLA